jgi:chemotaxis protein histidine kinase CheA
MEKTHLLIEDSEEKSKKKKKIISMKVNSNKKDLSSSSTSEEKHSSKEAKKSKKQSSKEKSKKSKNNSTSEEKHSSKEAKKSKKQSSKEKTKNKKEMPSEEDKPKKTSHKKKETSSEEKPKKSKKKQHSEEAKKTSHKKKETSSEEKPKKSKKKQHSEEAKKTSHKKKETSSEEKPKSIFRDDEEDTDPGKDIPTFDITDKIDQSATWRFTPMYKDKLTGAMMIWWVGFDVDTNELMMAHGQVGGKIQVNRTLVELNQSNRDMKTQSLLEATQRRLEKYRSGYRGLGEEPPEIGEAMLAAKWIPEKTRLVYPVGVEPKLDGVRCLARIAKSGEVVMRSRNSVAWQAASQKWFEDDIALLISLLPGATELDGEMYGSDLKFEDIVSIIKDPKKMAKRVNEIAYNIFTYADKTTPAETRAKHLKKAMKRYKEMGGNSKRIKLVPMSIAENKEEIFDYHKQFLKAGYEGTIIYKFGNGDPKLLKASLYKPKRSNNVLKYKATLEGADMEEEEGKIVGVYEGKGNQSGAIMFEVIDPRGNQFKVGLMGSIEKRRKMMKKGKSYIGKLLTYKYQNLTKYNVPRFPIGKAIRDYE